MPKKKANPFLMFMLELKNNDASKGSDFRGMEDLMMRAGKQWERMDKAARAPYVAKAAAANQAAKDVCDKLTGIGVSYTTVAETKQDDASKSQRVTDRMTAMISAAAEKNELEKLEVFFIAFQHFCVLSDERRIPAEMAVIRYSLGEGVMDRFHTCINPGPLPLGYALAAQNQSDLTHRLPIPPEALGEANYETIALRLFEFLSKNGTEMPILFTNSDDLSIVESMLDDVVQDFAPELVLHVCSLSTMFYELKKATVRLAGANGRKTPSAHWLQALIDKDVYDFTANISCEFHEAQGTVKYCALSSCVRWAYTISDCCGPDLKIRLQPGKHLPERADTGQERLASRFDSLSFASRSGDESSATLAGLAADDASEVGSVGAWGGAGPSTSPTVNDQPTPAVVRSVLSGGRGSRLKLDAACEVNQQRMGAGFGRGKRLNIADFPALGSSSLK